MAKFLVEANYTASGAKGLLKDGGTGRQAVVHDVCAQMGGKVEALYFAFGDHDFYGILDLPDNASMAAVEFAVKASGAIHTKTIVLLTPEEIDAAARKPVEFRTPGA